jgi:beta-glucosidase
MRGNFFHEIPPPTGDPTSPVEHTGALGRWSFAERPNERRSLIVGRFKMWLGAIILRSWCGVPSLCLIATFSIPPASVAQDYDRRAHEIVQQMTLDEKIQELHGIHDSMHYRYVPPVQRLHIPAFQITNGPAGAGPGGTHPHAKATALPSPISLASTWDTNVARQYGAIAAAEAKDIGNVLLEAPTINIARIPQNGRTFEGYGEDPYLTGQMSLNNIRGIQSQGVMANVKHYVANNQETDRLTVDEQVDERTLREIYLPAFERSIREGHSASVMCAYPRINGTFSCENAPLLNDLLKGEWGFRGFVISDFGAVHSTVGSAMAGLDLEMPTGSYLGEDLKAAVRSGQVPMSVIDDKLVRRFRTMMEFGVFDHLPTPAAIPAQKDGVESRKIASEGMVLLKNAGGLLPLYRTHLKSIALIGPMATKAVTGGGGSSHVEPLYTVDPLEGIRRRAGKVEVKFADGSNLARAAALARACDIAIVMVGEIDTEGRDHPIMLDRNQDELVEAVVEANPRTIVVLKTGSAVLIPWVDKVPAILEAWYPGEEDGNAIADVLFGAVNPSGKLPITFPRKLEDLPTPSAEQYPGTGGVARYSEGVFVGYRHYDQEKIVPLFPFGYGLSYTAFAYRNLSTTSRTFRFEGRHPKTISVDVDISNVGLVAGAEVVQLYAGLPSNPVPQPPKQLKGFQKVMLKPGESTHVRFALDAKSLSYWDTATRQWRVAPGSYHIMVGSSSRDIRLQETIEVQAANEATEGR